MSINFCKVPPNDPCLVDSRCSICLNPVKDPGTDPMVGGNPIAHPLPRKWWQGLCSIKKPSTKPRYFDAIHEKCLQEWIKVHPICPTCRRPVQQSSLKERTIAELKLMTKYAVVGAVPGAIVAGGMIAVGAGPAGVTGALVGALGGVTLGGGVVGAAVAAGIESGRAALGAVIGGASLAGGAMIASIALGPVGAIPTVVAASGAGAVIGAAAAVGPIGAQGAALGAAIGGAVAAGVAVTTAVAGAGAPALGAAIAGTVMGAVEGMIFGAFLRRNFTL